MIKRLLAAGIFVFFLSTTASALDLPKPAGFVNDFAGILSQQERASLEAILSDFEKSTSNEITVAIVDSFQGLDRFSYSQELFTAWDIGKENKDNGVLFLIGPVEGQPFPEHGDAFINVGKGLEGAFPDSLAGTILRQEVFPQFKNGDFSAGVSNGVSAIMKATQGEYKADEKEKNAGGGINIVPLFWFGFIFISYLVSFLGRTKSWWLGGVFGGIAGAVLGVILFAGIAILGSAAVLGVLGLIFDYAVSKNYAYRKAHGKPTDFWHSGGGFWFGGGGRGLGSGFGGFGGGMSGGGGAGGRW